MHGPEAEEGVEVEAEVEAEAEARGKAKAEAGEAAGDDAEEYKNGSERTADAERRVGRQDGHTACGDGNSNTRTGIDDGKKDAHDNEEEEEEEGHAEDADNGDDDQGAFDEKEDRRLNGCMARALRQLQLMLRGKRLNAATTELLLRDGEDLFRWALPITAFDDLQHHDAHPQRSAEQAEIAHTFALLRNVTVHSEWIDQAHNLLRQLHILRVDTAAESPSGHTNAFATEGLNVAHSCSSSASAAASSSAASTSLPNASATATTTMTTTTAMANTTIEPTATVALLLLRAVAARIVSVKALAAIRSGTKAATSSETSTAQSHDEHEDGGNDSLRTAPTDLSVAIKTLFKAGSDLVRFANADRARDGVHCLVAAIRIWDTAKRKTFPAGLRTSDLDDLHLVMYSIFVQLARALWLLGGCRTDPATPSVIATKSNAATGPAKTVAQAAERIFHAVVSAQEVLEWIPSVRKTMQFIDFAHDQAHRFVRCEDWDHAARCFSISLRRLDMNATSRTQNVNTQRTAARALLGLAYTLFQQQKHSEALLTLDRVTKLSLLHQDKEVQALLHYGRFQVYLSTRHVDEAEQQLMQLVTVGCPPVEQALACVRDFCAASHFASDALGVFSTLLQTYDRDPDFTTVRLELFRTRLSSLKLHIHDMPLERSTRSLLEMMRAEHTSGARRLRADQLKQLLGDLFSFLECLRAHTRFDEVVVWSELLQGVTHDWWPSMDGPVAIHDVETSASVDKQFGTSPSPGLANVQANLSMIKAEAILRGGGGNDDDNNVAAAILAAQQAFYRQPSMAAAVLVLEGVLSQKGATFQNAVLPVLRILVGQDPIPGSGDGNSTNSKRSTIDNECDSVSNTVVQPALAFRVAKHCVQLCAGAMDVATLRPLVSAARQGSRNARENIRWRCDNVLGSTRLWLDLILRHLATRQQSTSAAVNDMQHLARSQGSSDNNNQNRHNYPDDALWCDLLVGLRLLIWAFQRRCDAESGSYDSVLAAERERDQDGQSPALYRRPTKRPRLALGSATTSEPTNGEHDPKSPTCQLGKDETTTGKRHGVAPQSHSEHALKRDSAQPKTSTAGKDFPENPTRTPHGLSGEGASQLRTGLLPHLQQVHAFLSDAHACKKRQSALFAALSPTAPLMAASDESHTHPRRAFDPTSSPQDPKVQPRRQSSPASLLADIASSLWSLGTRLVAALQPQDRSTVTAQQRQGSMHQTRTSTLQLLVRLFDVVEFFFGLHEAATVASAGATAVPEDYIHRSRLLSMVIAACAAIDTGAKGPSKSGADSSAPPLSFVRRARALVSAVSRGEEQTQDDLHSSCLSLCLVVEFLAKSSCGNVSGHVEGSFDAASASGAGSTGEAVTQSMLNYVEEHTDAFLRLPLDLLCFCADVSAQQAKHHLAVTAALYRLSIQRATMAMQPDYALLGRLYRALFAHATDRTQGLSVVGDFVQLVRVVSTTSSSPHTNAKETATSSSAAAAAATNGDHKSSSGTAEALSGHDALSAENEKKETAVGDPPRAEHPFAHEDVDAMTGKCFNTALTLLELDKLDIAQEYVQRYGVVHYRSEQCCLHPQSHALLPATCSRLLPHLLTYTALHEPHHIRATDLVEYASTAFQRNWRSHILDALTTISRSNPKCQASSSAMMALAMVASAPTPLLESGAAPGPAARHHPNT